MLVNHDVVLGEYGYLSKQYGNDQIIDCLCRLAHDTEDVHTRSAAVSATMSSVLKWVHALQSPQP